MYEFDSDSDPASVRNNDLFDCPTALYYDEGTTAITSIATVNALGDTTASGNVSADPLFEDQAGGDWHFTVSTLATVDEGGLNGIDDGGWGFTDDKDGDPRPGTGSAWSMGAYEP